MYRDSRGQCLLAAQGTRLPPTSPSPLNQKGSNSTSKIQCDPAPTCTVPSTDYFIDLVLKKYEAIIDKYYILVYSPSLPTPSHPKSQLLEVGVCMMCKKYGKSRFHHLQVNPTVKSAGKYREQNSKKAQMSSCCYSVTEGKWSFLVVSLSNWRCALYFRVCICMKYSSLGHELMHFQRVKEGLLLFGKEKEVISKSQVLTNWGN